MEVRECNLSRIDLQMNANGPARLVSCRLCRGGVVFAKSIDGRAFGVMMKQSR